MVAQLVPPPHPILACAEQICSELAATTDLQPVYMRSDDKRAVLLMLIEAQRRLDELHLRVIAASDDVAANDGARDVAAWLASRTQADPPDLRADQAWPPRSTSGGAGWGLGWPRARCRRSTPR